MGSSSSADSDSDSDSSMKGVDREDIPDDVWSEIFLHLPFNSIFKFRCVSKVWFSILSNPYFTNKWYQLNYLSLPWASVEVENHSQGSSSSLVLCTPSVISRTYYECDPLTQKWDLLPPSPPREDDFAVSGIVCNYQFCSSSVISKSYKVIRIPNFAAAANEFTVEIFSSDLGEWKIYDVSCPQYVTWDIDYFYGNLFTHNGVFYWFQQRNRKILAVIVNGNTNHGTSGPKCRMIKMPGEAVDGDIKHLSECLGESEGLICFARFQETEMSLSA